MRDIVTFHNEDATGAVCAGALVYVVITALDPRPEKTRPARHIWMATHLFHVYDIRRGCIEALTLGLWLS